MPKPNVLLILSDQQRYDTIGQAGYNHMKTPCLDKLAQEGVLYCNAHSGNPVCMPARHDLITGFPARVHGYYANGESQRIRDYRTPTIARIFSDQDYRTVAVGKMHFSPPREHHGFDELYLMEELPTIRERDQYAMYLKEQGLGEVQNLHGVRPHIYHIPQNAMMDDEHHGTNWVANRSIEWLQENGDNPFFMMCGFIQPHPPWNIPTAWDGLYDGVEIPSAIEKSRLPFEAQTAENWFGDADTDEQKQQIRKAYYTSVSMVDRSVGRIVEHLRQTGQLENTLIIYTSDHGEMLQDKGYYSKELPYDSAVRVPMIIRYPQGKQGVVCNDLVDLLDVLPTCLDVCGLNYPDSKPLFGHSLQSGEGKPYQLSASGTMPWRWVLCRNQEYKYIYHYNGGYEELYPANQPEVKNLLADGVPTELQAVYDELKVQAIAYETDWGIEGGVVDGAFVPVETQTAPGSLRGKFHCWSNHQMQQFDRNPHRGKQLETEMKAAVSNVEKSGVTLTEVFQEESWQQDFAEAYQDYTDDTYNQFPFQEEKQ